MAGLTANVKFMTEFIELYRDCPCLWRIKSAEYKDKYKREQCYSVLVSKLKEIEPTADREAARKKINILRTNYRRELKKVIDSKRSGAGAEDIYIPTLWYFNELNFLKDHELPSPSVTTMGNEIGEGGKETDSISFVENTTSTINPTTPTIKRKKNNQDILEEKKIKLMEEAVNRISHVNESEVLAKAWALQYSKLQLDQQDFARKGIHDILFEGSMGTLHRNSFKHVPSRSSRPSTQSFLTYATLPQYQYTDHSTVNECMGYEDEEL